MFKQVLIATVLMSLLIGSSWDAEASEPSSLRHEEIIDFHKSEAKVREKRFINPLTSILNVWNALTHMYQLYSEVSEHITDQRLVNRIFFFIQLLL